MLIIICFTVLRKGHLRNFTCVTLMSNNQSAMQCIKSDNLAEPQRISEVILPYTSALSSHLAHAQHKTSIPSFHTEQKCIISVELLHNLKTLHFTPLCSIQGYYKFQQKDNNNLCRCKINSRELPSFSYSIATNFSPSEPKTHSC